MLKKMRWHFIAAAMAAFSSVILILLCIINFWNIQSTVHQLDDTLTLLSDMAGDTGSRPPRLRQSQRKCPLPITRGTFHRKCSI